MPVLPWEETITCPYDPSHQITRKIIQKHLVKCRRNHPDTDLVVCSFNSTHHISSKIIRKHEMECPDKKLFEQIMFIPENQMRTPTPVSLTPTCGPDDEDWEAELIKVPYNPSEAAAKKNVVRKIEGVIPSQRKAFRMEEVQRLRSFDVERDEFSSAKSDSEDEVAPDTKPKSKAVRGRGKGILLVKLRKLRMTMSPSSLAPSQSPSGSGEAGGVPYNNNKMKRKGSNVELGSPDNVQVPAKRAISKGRGRIKWEVMV